MKKTTPAKPVEAAVRHAYAKPVELPATITVKLIHNYHPMGEYTLVGENMPPMSSGLPGVPSSGRKLWAGATVTLPRAEAIELIERGNALPS